MRAERAAITLGLVLAVSAQASEPPATGRLEPEAIRAALDQDRSSSAWWFWGWSAGFTTASVVQLTLSGTTDSEGFRADTAAGGVGSSLGLIGLAIGQMRPEVDVPVTSDPDALTRALREQARREAAATGWLPYVLCTAVATGASLYLWLGKDRPIQAGVTFGLDFLVGGTQIWTVPTHSLELWEQAFPGVDP